MFDRSLSADRGPRPVLVGRQAVRRAVTALVDARDHASLLAGETRASIDRLVTRGLLHRPPGRVGLLLARPALVEARAATVAAVYGSADDDGLPRAKPAG